MPKTILIFAYYSYYDPVFQSAVLPYFLNFPEKDKFRFILLTFEQKAFKTTPAQNKEIAKSLLRHNIIWYNLRWNSGRFKFLKKIYDFTKSILTTLYLTIRYHVVIVYSEGFPGAIITHFLTRITKKKHIVHTFEPHADYMVEGAHWNKNSWESRLLYSLEKKIAKGCSHIFTGTDKMKERIHSWGTKAKIYKVPSCVDVSLFKYSPENRASIRKQYNIRDQEIVLVYLGKFGGNYWDHELFQLFAFCEQEKTSFKYFIFSTENHNMIQNYIAGHRLPEDKFIVKTLTKEEVPQYLSAADMAISAVRPLPSRRYSSPIKNGEYWSCGLPIVIPSGVSDDYIYAKQNGLGIVINDLSDKELKTAATKISEWFRLNNKDSVRKKCSEFVKNDRNVEDYKQLLKQVLEN